MFKKDTHHSCQQRSKTIVHATLDYDPLIHTKIDNNAQPAKVGYAHHGRRRQGHPPSTEKFLSTVADHA